MPMAISAILDASPRPMTMNRIGSNASGGTIETAPRKGARPARSSGSSPISMPSTRVIVTVMPSAENRRPRLAAVSSSSRIFPVRGSAMKPIRMTESASPAKLGSSLSFGLSASRAAEAAA